MRQALLAILAHFPRLKAILLSLRARLMPNRSVSSGYVALTGEEAGAEGERLRTAWQDDVLPRRQRELVDDQLQQYRLGKPVAVFDVLVNALRELPGHAEGQSLLEIGCSSGFYSEVLDVAGLNVSYTGCDYSPAFVELAREKYPTLDFMVADATALQYPDAAFDIVVSGCCLLHISEYPRAVAETARVARRYAIFHRTPVVLGKPNVYYRKQAYGVETLEIHFNEPQFLDLLAKNGLELMATYTLSETVVRGVGSADRTYVCRKISR